jgi:hypothetical protein
MIDEPAPTSEFFADGHARCHTAFDHGLPQRPRVEIHESLMHHGRTNREVCAKSHAVRIGDAHAFGRDVICHARELIDRRHRDMMIFSRAAIPQLIDIAWQYRSGRCPRNVGQQTKD